MELLMALAVGTLFGTGLYLCLRRRTFQLVLGMVLLSHGANLLILNMGRIRRGLPPLVTDGVTEYTDPLVQALILTAIVIGFGVTAFLLVLSMRSYQENGDDSVNIEQEEQPH
jgi:multisubunit Na+/H+ antiporter MnhC subunit